MIAVRWLIILLIAACCATDVGAQSESRLREGDLTIDIDVRFISSYRDGSWVPIDIIVSNNQRDITGYLEVVAMQAGVPQPPAYRIPVDSPKGSRKRFRLYCLLDGTTDLEAMLYRGRRQALEVPMKIALRPIDRNDYLCLVLDDQPSDYSYLYSAVLDDTTDQGFYRIELKGDELGSLPDRLPCYDPIDLIVMGDIDPSNVSLRHRALITRYVENGGTLVFCSGENTSQYRGTWVEDLAGVTLGSQQMVNERQFAEMAFTSPSTDRLRDTKQGEFTPLTPNADGLMRWGGEEALATVRPVGGGFVGVVALDMAGKLLHTTSEYRALWTQLADMRASQPEVNFAETSSFLRNQLPNVAGVRVFPRSSVATYLTLYLLIAIIGNWVFWSFMKRREMAWVCLVFFSVGFTTYAMVYGTAGRAKETELEQVNIVRVYKHTPVAKVHTTIGLLSARSARYAFSLADEAGLVSQGAFTYGQIYPGMRRNSNRLQTNSFAFVGGAHPRVEDLRVGASVMRTLQVESELTLTGGFEGTLTHDENGLHGTLTNQTGLRIQEPWIFYMGRTIRAKAKPGGDTIEVKMPKAKLDSPQLTAASMNANIYYGGYDYGLQSVQNAIREPITSLIFTSLDDKSQLDPSLGPFVYGWATDSPPNAVNLEEDAKLKIRETFIVADIEVEGSEVQFLQRPLVVGTGTGQMSRSGYPYYQDWNNRSQMMRWDQRSTVVQGRQAIEIDLPRDVAARAEGDLIIDLKWATERNQRIQFQPKDAPPEWQEDHAEWEKSIREQGQGMNLQVMRYRLNDWQTHYDESEGVILGHIVLVPDREAQRARSTWAQFTVKAHIEVSPKRLTSKEWKAWP